MEASEGKGDKQAYKVLCLREAEGKKLSRSARCDDARQ